MSERQWYHDGGGGNRIGPMSERAIRAVILAGQIGPSTLVWSDGMADWAPLAGTPLGDRQASGVASGAEPASGNGWRDSGAVASGATAGGPGKPMGFGEAIGSVLSNYVTFEGRASRSEYWYFVLFGFLLSLVTNVIDRSMLAAGIVPLVGLVASLALFLPNLAVTVRRLHDVDRTGWWVLAFPLATLAVAFVAASSSSPTLAVMAVLAIVAMVITWLVFICTGPTPGRNSYG